MPFFDHGAWRDDFAQARNILRRAQANNTLHTLKSHEMTLVLQLKIHEYKWSRRDEDRDMHNVPADKEPWHDDGMKFVSATIEEIRNAASREIEHLSEAELVQIIQKMRAPGVPEPGFRIEYYPQTNSAANADADEHTTTSALAGMTAPSIFTAKATTTTTTTTIAAPKPRVVVSPHSQRLWQGTMWSFLVTYFLNLVRYLSRKRDPPEVKQARRDARRRRRREREKYRADGLISGSTHRKRS
ncbi:uncharacterized protein I303_103198 [Kwoniella dejecticola CBS 10117]|uniref:Uncharacterized protein n=1 Tax=Kwoniella dejecticola CBS 10117 TaxID=1296121 RepID=A0A1A6AAV4_9TREE|nr:uncharacterized protein I303_03221 [Kwoniella dejecticola CBS 10117]OBR87197.1 hypothetical protein I303_03221 [Kwoniella dejecticola CBS 10117]